MTRPTLRVAAVATGFVCVSVIVMGTAVGTIGTSADGPIAAAVQLQQEDPASRTVAVAAPGTHGDRLITFQPPIEVGYPALECDGEGNCDPGHTVAVDRSSTASDGHTSERQTADPATAPNTVHGRAAPPSSDGVDALRDDSPRQLHGSDPQQLRSEHGRPWSHEWPGLPRRGQEQKPPEHWGASPSDGADQRREERGQQQNRELPEPAREAEPKYGPQFEGRAGPSATKKDVAPQSAPPERRDDTRERGRPGFGKAHGWHHPHQPRHVQSHHGRHGR